MIIKSFLRDKNTKIYILLYFLMFLLMVLLFKFLINYLKKYNDNYEQSFIYTKYDYKGLEVENKIEAATFDNYFFVVNNELKNNEIIIPNILKYDDNKITLCDYNCIEYKVVNVHSGVRNIIYISKDSFYNFKEKGYIIKLKNWLLHKRVEKIIKDKDYQLYSFQSGKTDMKLDYIFYITILFIILLIFILLIIILLNIRFIILDNKEKNKLYKSLGFTNKSIILYSIIKIIIILVISSFIPIIIIFI